MLESGGTFGSPFVIRVDNSDGERHDDEDRGYNYYEIISVVS